MANERLNENLISRITEIIQQQIEVRMSAHDEELQILKERMDTLAHDVRSLSLGASDMRVEQTRTRDSDSFGDNDGAVLDAGLLRKMRRLPETRNPRA